MTMITPTTQVTPEAVSFHPQESLNTWRTATGVKRFADEPDALGRRHNAQLRLKLIREEFREVSDELLDFMNGHGDRVKLAKELADLVYVAFGAADVFDIPLEQVFDAVHASNMTKVGADGKVEKRGDGKILKGPNYKEPDIASIILPGVSS